MNRKKISAILACVLTASLFTACTNNTQKITFSSNWQTDITVFQENITEEATYNVSFEKNETADVGYTLDYTNGVYTTKLSTEQYNGDTIYVYETHLQIDVVYQFGTEIEQFTDSVLSIAKFEKADNALKPISSHKAVVSHSPSNNATSLENCYALYDYTVDITYDENYSGTCVISNAENTDTVTDDFSVSTKKYTCLDNEQLTFALRGVNPDLSSSATFHIYSPFVKATQKIKATFASAEGEDFVFEKNGEKAKYTIQYHPVSVKLDAKNSGATQTLWIAKTTDSISNTYRNLILRMEAPLSYNLGKFIYELTSVNFS